MPSHSRRASTSRTPSPDDDMDDEDELLSPDDLPSSPTHLVLVQEPEDLPELELWESDSDELESGGRQSEDYPSNSIPRTSQSAHIEPLNTFQILPLLVAPNLKLGAALLLSFSLQRDSLPLSVPGAAITLILLAFLNPLATQIYMMLCQYVGKWTIEGVLGEALFGVSTGGHRGSRQEERRHQSPWKKGVVRAARATVALAGALLCAAYLRECTDLLVPLVPKSSYTFERVGVTFLLGVVVSPLLHTTSIASKRVRYSNILSIGLYAIAVIVVISHRFQGGGGERASERQVHDRRGPIKVHLTGGVWEWLNMSLFAYNTQLFTYPLFAAFTQSRAAVAARQNQSRRSAPIISPISPATPSKSRRKPKKKNTAPVYDFLLLVCIASAASIVLLAVPLFVGYGKAIPSSPSPTHGQSPEIHHPLREIPERLRTSINDHFVTALRILQSGCLLLAIPPIWVSTVRPRLYSPSVNIRWVQEIKWHWVLFVSLLSLSAFSPPSLAHFVARSACWFVTGIGYFLPAILHSMLHTFRKPLSIILPAGPDSTDDLLLRKERSLQRKRFMRRAGWDLGVWVLLWPIGAISWLWWAGRIVGLW